MTPAVAAVIVNYNAGAELVEALRSIARELSECTWEAVVVDNASADGSATAAAAVAPHVRVLRNAENVGFARGVNRGLRETTAPLVVIMNPDCRLLPGALKTLHDELERYSDCAIAGPRILDPDGSVQGSARGDPDMLTGLFGRSAFVRRLFPRTRLARRNVLSDDAIASGKRSVEVDWLSGACMLARRAPLETVGGFDERYFLYWEDADLCRRLRARGHHVRYVPGATAVHRVGHSSRTAKAASIRAFHASAYLYYATHVAPGRFSIRRTLARALLSARCRLSLLRAHT